MTPQTNPRGRRLCLAVLLALTSLVALPPLASAADLSGQYTWKPVEIGANGLVTAS